MKYIVSFHFACKSLLSESVYEPGNVTELIFMSFVVIFNGIVFSVVINYVGKIIDNMNKREEEIDEHIKILEKFFQ